MKKGMKQHTFSAWRRVQSAKGMAQSGGAGGLTTESRASKKFGAEISHALRRSLYPLRHAFCALLLLALAAPVFAQSEVKSPHGALKWDCQSCHGTESWKKLRQPMAFKHADTGFLLLGAHQFTNCAGCHQSLKFAEVGSACADCHTDVHRGQFGLNCQNCHTADSWSNQKEILQLHAARGFPLTGVHAVADCQACHRNEQFNEFSGTPMNCSGCHLTDYTLADNPDHAKAGFSIDCESCHRPVALKWENTTFQHTTAFELRGAHRRVECNSCHANTYFGTSGECYSCHSGDFQQTANPPHVQLGFSQNCTICHTEERWEGAFFDHVQSSGFELRGIHAGLSCNDCHVNNQFTGLPRDCFGCHQSDYTATTDPNHVLGQFPLDCLVCHNETAWQPALFDHNRTGFPLTGAHQILTCESCHQNGQYTALPTDCFSCHESDYNAVTDPNHAQNNFSHDCLMCHNTSAFSPATFDHSQTQFPLTGAHLLLQCLDCHSAGYTNTPTDCYSCHESDYNAVTDPNHVQNNFSHDCTQCHTTTAFSPATFDHSQTQFPLTGAHLLLQCLDCHSAGYTNTPTDCYSCHESDYNAVTDPNHVQNNFSHDCTQCHTTTAFSPATFDHSQTQFPLTGAHLLLQCLDCHSAGYTNTPTDCYSCHESDYNAVTDPNHVQNNFSHDCTQCHTTTAFSPATFDHSQTQFPLTGAHLLLQCLDCHSAGYTNTPTDCYSCHESDYNAVTDPNHVQNNFSHDCTQCHTTTAFSPATFDHSQTQFPLTGAHLLLQCLDCHSAGYSGTPTECFACHQDDYNSANDPNHLAAGFPTNCQECHNTSNWNQTTWNHDVLYFPIYSGKHQGKWEVCADCHVNPTSFAVFECIFCHEHNQQSMNEKHQGVPGYVYQSAACYDCHPNGEEKLKMPRRWR